MTKEQTQLAQAQSIASRAIMILDEHNFWETSRDGEFWEASLYNDLKKLAEGVELVTYAKERKLLYDRIKELQGE